MPLKVGIVVGESSGDILGAGLINELKKIYPNLEVEGVVGPNLIATESCTQLFSMEELSFIGFLEPLLNIFRLLKLRKWLARYFIEEPPDIFIGIDAPEFNLGLEKQLKEAGIPTVHYVSPQVWAWREYRVKKIKRCLDLLLCLFPFEEKFYHEHNVPAKFIGHPTADKIPASIDQDFAKEKLGLPKGKTIIALLPGSRASELNKHTKLFLIVAKKCYKKNSNLHFITSLVKEEQKEFFNYQKEHYAPNLPLTVLAKKSYDVMAASDIVLVSSGTATLEVMLHNKPMVVAYKTNWLTYFIVKLLIKVKYISLPNILAQKEVVPELIQKFATVKNLSKHLMNLINDFNARKKQKDVFIDLSPKLRQNANQKAAEAIKTLLDERERNFDF